jgi:hypothetical protein
MFENACRLRRIAPWWSAACSHSCSARPSSACRRRYTEGAQEARRALSPLGAPCKRLHGRAPLQHVRTCYHLPCRGPLAPRIRADDRRPQLWVALAVCASGKVSREPNTSTRCRGLHSSSAFPPPCMPRVELMNSASNLRMAFASVLKKTKKLVR